MFQQSYGRLKMAVYSTERSLVTLLHLSYLEPVSAGRGDAIDAVVVSGLRKSFQPSGAAVVRALRGVDLTVGMGEFVAVMGPSGCGKSTLLHLIAGLDRPNEGSVVLAGIRIETLSADQAARVRRRHIGLVFQFFELIENMSVMENVTLAALLGGSKPARARQRAADLLDVLGLLDRAQVFPAALSGGQRQRLAIARALANRPTVLLADEPTGALDSDGAAEIVELLRRLHRDGQTIVLVTHNPEVAAAAGRVVGMRDGRIADPAGNAAAAQAGPA
jgi:putative ABC transport system ATP-binding protein